MLAATNYIALNTDPMTAERINRQMQMSIAYHQKRPDMIESRINELDREWDVERVLRVAASSTTLAGILLSVLRGRKWILVSAAAQALYLQQTLKGRGWSPAINALRKLGFRTIQEIDEERHALAAIRGDYAELTAQSGGEAQQSEPAIPARQLPGMETPSVRD